MARYKVILIYDGTEYFGFQRQASHRSEQTVQGMVEVALKNIGWTGNSILAAGRTDAGVHAKGQVISFDLDWKHPSQDLLAALNANLPPDIAVAEVKVSGDQFHPRFDALSRTYQYRVFCQSTRDPLRERYAWRVDPQVEVELLDLSAAALVGIYDFAAFGAPPRAGATTTRQVCHSEWSRQANELVFEIQANAFLYHMVRRLVGYQVALSQGKHSLDDLQILLKDPPQEVVKELAPPNGLTLVEVRYPENVVNKE